MELYLSPKVVGKGQKGRTACGSSAYRSCDKIIDNAGRTHDYRNKGGYVTGGIELPEGAPAELLDRQTLWSRHEAKDIRKDAELFREVTLALSNELSYAAAEKVMRKLAKKLTDMGMCVQWDIHDTTKNGQRNLHAHMMITMRELMPDGTFGNKNRSWNRYNGGLNIADLLRPEAARLMNEELELIGSADRVEHESFANRGIDRIPTKHMGVAATAMERDRKNKKGEVIRAGQSTRKGDQNRYIDWLNQIHADNLRAASSHHLQSGSVEDLIGGAEEFLDGKEVFKDWDALFAMLRDTRRCRAAMNCEVGKIGKIISAYEEHDDGYLRWAGCDPNSEAQEQLLQSMQQDLRLRIKELDIMEAALLDSKELYKAHNKVFYTAKKADWDQYMVLRSKKSVKYFARRIDSVNRYMSRLSRHVSLFDTLFDADYQAKMAELQEQKEALKERYREEREKLKVAKKELKDHKKEAREAKKEEKAVRKTIDKDQR